MKKEYKTKSIEERKQEIDEAMKLVEEGVEEYLTSDRFHEVLKNVSKFHQYSFNNQMLILKQNPTASYIASFQNWKTKFNRVVQRGETGMKIFVPVEYKIYAPKLDPATNEPMLDENGRQIKVDTGKKGLGFKLGSVFDYDQTKQIEGKEEIKITLGIEELEGSVENYQDLLTAIYNIVPVPIEFKNTGSNAKGYFSPTEEKIVINPDMSELQTLKTLIHETAHSVLHNTKRLDELKKKGIEFSRSDKETQAESVAYAVSYHCGLDTSEYSFPYVAGWSGNIDTIRQNMEQIRYAANEIIEGMDKQLELIVSKDMEEDLEEDLEMEM